MVQGGLRRGAATRQETAAAASASAASPMALVPVSPVVSPTAAVSPLSAAIVTLAPAPAPVYGPLNLNVYNRSQEKIYNFTIGRT